MGTIKQNFANNIETGGKLDAKDLSGVIPASNIADASVSDVTSISPSIGDTIQTVSSDVSPASFGDIWYNSTLQKVRLLQFGTGTWASGGNVNSARSSGQGAGATHSAAVIWSGEGPSPADRAKTESYDGSSWTEVNDLNSARIYPFGDGTQTAAFTAGGHNPSNAPVYRTETETWDGTSWTVLGPANLNTGRAQGGSNGITTSALAYTGESPGPPPRSFYNNAEELDGSTWTNITSLNRGPNNQSCRFTSQHLGRTAPASRVAGGGYNAPASGVNLNEEWNGTSWAEEAELNTARGAIVGGSGTVNDCIIFGGGPDWTTGLTNTESWDGTSWTEINDLATGKRFASNAGSTSQNAMAATGSPAAVGTEEWTVPPQTQSISGS